MPPDLVANLRRGLATGVVTEAGDAVGVVEEPPAVLGAGAVAVASADVGAPTGAGDKGTVAVPGIAAGDGGAALFTSWRLVNTGADLLGADELATPLPPGSAGVIVPAYSLTAFPRDRLIASSSTCCSVSAPVNSPTTALMAALSSGPDGSSGMLSTVLSTLDIAPSMM